MSRIHVPTLVSEVPGGHFPGVVVVVVPVVLVGGPVVVVPVVPVGGPVVVIIGPVGVVGVVVDALHPG
jgi:hypothetical protein